MESNTRSSKKKKKSPILIIVIVIILIAVVAIGGFNLYLSNGAKAANPADSSPVTVVIPEGSGTGNIAAILLENNLINDATVFKLQSKIKGNDGKYKAGTFVLSPVMPMSEIMDIIIEGKQISKRFTIPEGYDIRRTTEKLTSEGFVNSDVFLDEIENGDYDYAFLKDAPVGPGRLEGYLYPETYDVFENASEVDIINIMLSQFDKMFTKDLYDRAKELDLNMNEVLTIASLVEREAKLDEERAIISSVIRNRLDAGMPLEFCSTIQFALGEQKERLLYEDLRIESPYNTYTNKGLPPGPICSPGIDSIKAALYPKDTDYLFFVVDPDSKGGHFFSKDYNKFLKDKDAYIDNTF